MVRFAIGIRIFTGTAIRALPGRNLMSTELPVLTKQTVLEQRDVMVAGGLDQAGLKLGYTGGSTGKPLAFYYTDEKTEHMRAGMMRSYRWAGWRPGDRVLNFWGAQQDIRKPRKPGDRLRRYAAAEQTLGAYEYNETDLLELGAVYPVLEADPVAGLCLDAGGAGVVRAAQNTCACHQPSRGFSQRPRCCTTGSARRLSRHSRARYSINTAAARCRISACNVRMGTSTSSVTW